MTTARMQQIMLEVANGVPAPADEDPESRRVRARLAREIDQIRRRGGDVDVPSDIP